MIGKNTFINNNFCIVAYQARVFIGDNCLIGANFTALSSDFHGIDVKDRGDINAIKSDDIIIENDCFLGNNVTLLRGAKIGEGSVVAACSVVTKPFPKNCLIAGNPAKIIRQINTQS